jgi:NAD-dependent dihydropyrimidine dehydrogenase PreA subunit
MRRMPRLLQSMPVQRNKNTEQQGKSHYRSVHGLPPVFFCLFIRSNKTMRKKIMAFCCAAAIAVALITAGCGMGAGGAYLEVESSQCTGCAQCSGVCQVDAIRIIDGKAVIDPAKCVKCGKCVEVCPVNAIY